MKVKNEIGAKGFLQFRGVVDFVLLCLLGEMPKRSGGRNVFDS